MRRAIAIGLTILAFVPLAFAPIGAEARKRGGSTIPIIVPGMSSGDTLIKVRDLPKRPPFLDKEGNQIDLGYLWPRTGEPRWVGYASRTLYYDWPPATLEAVVAESGMGSLPPVPERPGRTAPPPASKTDTLSADEELEARQRGEISSASSSRSSGSIMLFLLIGMGAFIAVWRFLRRPSNSDTQAIAQSSGGARWVERAESRISPAAASTGRMSRPAVRPGSGSSGAAPISGLPPGRVGFGRRS